MEATALVRDDVFREDRVAVIETEPEPVAVVPAKADPDRSQLEAGRFERQEILVAEMSRVKESEEPETVGFVFPVADAGQRDFRGVEFEGPPSAVIAAGHALVETTHRV